MAALKSKGFEFYATLPSCSFKHVNKRRLIFEGTGTYFICEYTLPDWFLQPDCLNGPLNNAAVVVEAPSIPSV